MDAPSLRAALVALPLSDHGDEVFTARLAREQRWSPDHARRVVEEYRRFLELAATCGHRVVPAPAIDAAWHLHLLHTRAYWDGLCAGVLGRPLHHDPDAPGTPAAESARDLARTREAYRQRFGEPPPAIWAGRRPRGRWLLPAGFGALAVFGLGGCTPGAIGWWSAALLVLMGVAAVGGWILWALRQDRRRSRRRATGCGGAVGCGVGNPGSTQPSAGGHGHHDNGGGGSPGHGGDGGGGDGGGSGCGGGCSGN